MRHAIEHHVGLKRHTRLEPVETACLWDADKLSKIGAASLIHFTCIAAAFDPVDTAGHPRPRRGLAGAAPGPSPPP